MFPYKPTPQKTTLQIPDARNYLLLLRVGSAVIDKYKFIILSCFSSDTGGGLFF